MFSSFFLGASRGSIIALALPFIFYLSFTNSIRKNIALIVVIFLLIGIFVLAQNYFGSGVFDRFFNIKYDIEIGDSSSARLEIWQDTWQQFLSNPVFGNSLEADSVKFHPHNIFLEILITTGLFGFIPFIFLSFVFFEIKRDYSKNSQYSWVVAIFIISFSQNMFTGGIYSASWLALSAAMIIGFQKNVANFGKF
ncbi:MAG: O-antigen ligase family protein [Chromatiales bacterium]|nr:O-antigen ligase family protein [Chromatiales bacterium]